MIQISNLTKKFFIGDNELKVLDNISFNVKKGDYVSIVGPSGSGKSTLMNILGLLDMADSGQYILDGINIDKANENLLAQIRNKKIGFIFQNFNLLPKLTVIENIKVPLIYQGKTNEESQKIAIDLLDKVGLLDKAKNLPSQLSGGQQQRVAIARALSCNPEIILADEPTGALDSKTGIEIMKIFEKLNKQGQTIILITHDMNVAKRADRIIKIVDGKIHEGDLDDKV